MPVCLISNPSSYDRRRCTKSTDGEPPHDCQEWSGKHLAIGLINNMSDGALEATERQFLSLLQAASDGIPVCLSLYSMPDVPRGNAGAQRVSEFYSSAENLGDMSIDGLIVTGREPLHQSLEHEPYWENFKRILDWARENTYSTVWSCLAAHAAILYQDGIARAKSDHKHSGVFECAKLSEHPLIAGTPSRFKLPHSRWNGIHEEELTGSGYTVLTRAADAGVDTFIRQSKSMFVYFQGHPEYESNTLLLEYRRDVGRYLTGETSAYPSIPLGYFDRDTETALAALEQQTGTHPREELVAKVIAVLEKADIKCAWHSTAVRIYRNWLQYIWARKEQQVQSRDAAATNGRNVSLPSLVGVRGISA